MKSDKPNISLRVFRREKFDMTLVYNYKQIKNQFALSPIVSINKEEVKYTILTEKSSNAGDGDVKVYINYEENKTKVASLGELSD